MNKNFTEEAIQTFLNNPDTFFTTADILIKQESKKIWEEFIEWQRNGGKIRDFEIEEIKIEVMGFKETIFKVKLDENMMIMIPFEEVFVNKYLLKKGIQATYSFVLDKPQYLKFVGKDVFCNPIRLLLNHFLELKEERDER